jgi:hypothetical protein
MNILQKALFALVSGYVVSQMFKLPYNDCIYVACVSATVPLIAYLIGKFNRHYHQIVEVYYPRMFSISCKGKIKLSAIGHSKNSCFL